MKNYQTAVRRFNKGTWPVNNLNTAGSWQQAQGAHFIYLF